MRPYAVAVLFVLGIPVVAQTRLDPGESRILNPAVSYEVVALFGSDSTKQLVNIHYRIAQNFFIFVRNEAAVAKPQFVARGELVVELLDEQKTSAARDIRQIPLSRTTLPREGDRSPTLQGVFSFSVPPGTYTVVFDLEDRESGRSFMEKIRKVRVPAWKAASLEVSSPLLVQTPANDKIPEIFVPTNRGGNSLFGEGGGILTELVRPAAAEPMRLQWKLRGDLDGFGERKQEFEDSAYTSLNGLVALTPQEEGISYSVHAVDNGFVGLYIPLPLHKLEPGVFKLEINYRFGRLTKQQVHQFQVAWPSRPVSLMDPDLAIDALRHIASESEIDEILSGGATKRAEAFSRFWHARNRDTTTAFNDVMAEYYYRVDDALRKFSTARESDGYKTDRGRIYILYGPPQRSDRSLQPDSAPTEIWTYERLRKRFIFIDTGKSGNYVLSQSESL